MAKRSKMSRSHSKRDFTRKAVKHHRKNDLHTVVMRGGIRF